MSTVHEGPDVLPGRYPGSGIRFHDGATPQQVAVADERAEADALAGRICAAAAMSARSECQLVELIGEFDATGAIGWWSDMKSVPHWVSWGVLDVTGQSPGACPEGRALRRRQPLSWLG